MQSVLDILPSLKFPEFCIFEIFRAFRGSGQTSRVGSGKSAASGPGKQPSCAASTSKHSFFSFFFFSSSGGWVKIKLKLPHFQVGLVSMSTRPDPEGSDTVEMTTRRSSPGSVGLVRAHPLTKTQAMEPSRQTWPSYGPPYPLGRWSYSSLQAAWDTSFARTTGFM